MRAIVHLACVAGLSTGIGLSAAAQSAPATNGRHVWTNDDVEALRERDPVSVLGEPRSDATDGTSGADSDNAGEQRHRNLGQRNGRGQRYRRQLQPLYAEASKIESEIAEMRRWPDGSYRMTGLWPLRFAGMPLNPADRIAQLELREREVRQRISNLEDDARHAGVLPGELR